ncbi:MAG: glycoside hydrolase family 5 protein [Deltaproteobacteria bacterium]|nr:glycoside hydrolase family 5 protein [Deltaproteobacteria bacterium]
MGKTLVGGLAPWLLCLALACDAGAGGPEPMTHFIHDSDGRAMILRGVNVMSSSKSDPLRMPTLEAPDVTRMAERWGFDFVRFLIFWDALEPEPGVIDQAYLDRVEERLDWFAAADIAVLLDMHQDVYSARFCCDGAPEWAIHDDGLPFELQGVWFANYFQPAVVRAFDNFWSYEGEHRQLQDHYASAWAAVAQRFRDHPAVIGYDLMNEPSPGSAFDALELGRPANEDGASATFDRERLGPFYQRVIDAIRREDADTYLFYEPRYGFPGAGAASYLPTLSDPREGEARLVMAPHLYSIGLEATGAYGPGDSTVPDWEARRGLESGAAGTPVVLGEWGLDWSTTDADRFGEDVVSMADRLMAGWAYWSYDPGSWGFWDPATQTETGGVAHLVRPYPRRVAGEPLAFSWDAAAGVFSLRWRGAPEVTAPTELVLPARLFPEGYDVDLGADADAASQSVDAARGVLSIRLPADGREHQLRVTRR